MGIKASLSKIYAAFNAKEITRWRKNAVSIQQDVFQSLIKTSEATSFGKDHDFKGIKTYEDFKKRVPVRDYEGLRKYIDHVVAGEANVLWPGKPL